MTKVQQHFRDFTEPVFYDGSMGGLIKLLAPQENYPPSDNSNLNIKVRYNGGYASGQSEADDIINQLKRDKNGRIIEPIRIISHSMGGAYAKGFAQALTEYVKKHPKTTNGLKITEYDFAPYQPFSQEAVYGVDTYQYSHKHDWIAKDYKIRGAHFMKTSNENNRKHELKDYIEYINHLPYGEFHYEKNKTVKE